MMYTYDAKAFAIDFNAFLKSIDCGLKTAVKLTGLSVQPVRNAKNGKGIQGSSLAVLCYWADLDIRKYVKDEPGQAPMRSYQKTMKF